MTGPPEDPSDLVTDWINNWKRESHGDTLIAGRAKRMAFELRDWSGHPPRTVAAALVYHASQRDPISNDERPTQREVAEYFDCTSKTIRNVWEKVEPQLVAEIDWMEASDA